MTLSARLKNQVPKHVRHLLIIRVGNNQLIDATLIQNECL